jgi:LacI family transcriptional regulator
MTGMKDTSAPAPTIYDVARGAKVSIKTVSRVVNGEPNVKPETRQRVLEIAAALHYRPSLSARSLAGAKSYLLGLLCDNPSPAYVTDVQTGLTNRCRQAGYHLVVEPVSCDSPDVAGVVEALTGALRLDGVVLTPPVCDSAAVLDVLDRIGMPYARIAPWWDVDRGARVEMDDRRAAYEMTGHLLQLGHRDIGFIRGHPRHGASRRRFEGYAEALADQGVPLNPGWVAQGSFSSESGVACGQALLDRPDRPTAIFASNDDMGLGVLMVAARLGLSVPEQVSVAGFDDSTAAKIVWPPLTTVRQPVVDMAYAAADLVLSRDAIPGQPRARMLDFELVVRKSTSRPPGK